MHIFAHSISAEPDDISKTTAIVIGAVCSAAFLTIGVLLGVVGLYLIQRVRGRSSVPTYLSPPSLPPNNPTRKYVQTVVMTERETPADVTQQTMDDYEPMRSSRSPESTAQQASGDYEEPVHTSDDVATSQKPIYEPVYY